MEYARRKNIRLTGYDYSQQGGYFVTLCTHERVNSLANIFPGTERVRARIVLTELGQIADSVLRQLPLRYGYLLDAYVIMPNHVHMILIKKESGGMTVGQFVGAFKSTVSTQWYQECDRQGIKAGKLWQRNYYDHILRNEADYMEKLKYVDENADKWHLDKLYRN